jgi:protease-4
MSDEMRTLFQLYINKGYDDFISGVAANRSMEKEAVDDIAQGRIWTGNDAYENGLIDGIGDLDDAVSAAAELASLAAEEYGRKYFEQELSPGERLALDLMAGAKSLGLDVGVFARSPSSLERVAGMLEQTLSPLVRFNDPQGIYSHCFCDFN